MHCRFNAMAIRICVSGQGFRNKYSNINHVSRSNNNHSSPIRLQFRILKFEFSQYNLTKSEDCYLILKGNVLYALFAYLWHVVSPNGWTRKHMKSFVSATKGRGNQLYPIYILWDVTTRPCPWYQLVVQYSSYITQHLCVRTSNERCETELYNWQNQSKLQPLLLWGIVPWTMARQISRHLKASGVFIENYFFERSITAFNLFSVCAYILDESLQSVSTSVTISNCLNLGFVMA